MPETRKPFYVTTPIYYVNARPHIGHAYTTIVADVLARRHRLLGDDTFFLTGTDEHGQKIERSAAAAGIPPQQFADQVSKTFEDLWKRMGITNDAYIRTTDPRHQQGVQKLFATLYEKGYIYLASYTGSYCVSDEAFVDAPVGTPCPDCGRLLEEVTEENFFFKLSEFQLPLINLIESNELVITPESSRNEVLSFIRGDINTTKKDIVILSKAKDLLSSDQPQNLTFAYSAAGTPYIPGALRDLSISRSSFTWGISVPEPAASTAAQKHVIYVWLDALANYMTALGYGSDDTTLLDKFWPADLHLVGKEITRFHCVYWPAFLLAAGIALPKQITAHGWLLFDNSKMSKSKGNIVRTETILEGFGEDVYAKQFPDSTKDDRDFFASDVLRYFLLREIPFGQDGSFSFDAMITRYNADLANGYGNLVSRTLTLIAKTSGSVLEDCPEANSLVFYQAPRIETPSQPERQEILSASEGQLLGWAITKAVEAFISHMDKTAPTDALAAVARAVTAVDAFMSSRKPWAATDTELSQAGRRSTLYTAAESIRIITALLYPILPFATAKVWSQLGLGDIEQAAREGDLNNLEWGGLKPGTKLGPLGPIFPRADKGLAQIMTDMENPEAQSSTSSKLKAEQNPSSLSGSSLPGSSLHAVQTPSTDPAAGPRTASLDEPSGPLTVGGSSAHTTNVGPTPSHTEAVPSGPFASVAAQQPITAGPADASPQITIDDFAKIELRVAQIIVAERIPKADKLLRLEVDLGYEKRQILSGIAEFYTPEELLGRRIVVITNLAPRKMRGLESHGMLLAASDPGDDHGKPHLATCGDDIALGSRLK
jgi:methionyl-tRNA synthetase